MAIRFVGSVLFAAVFLVGLFFFFPLEVYLKVLYIKNESVANDLSGTEKV